MVTAAEIMMKQYPGETIADCIYRLRLREGPDMSKFTEWLMEMYPKTEDYVYLTEEAHVCMTGNLPLLYLRIKPDPQAFLEQMKDFDEMMED